MHVYYQAHVSLHEASIFQYCIVYSLYCFIWLVVCLIFLTSAFIFVDSCTWKYEYVKINTTYLLTYLLYSIRLMSVCEAVNTAM